MPENPDGSYTLDESQSLLEVMEAVCKERGWEMPDVSRRRSVKPTVKVRRIVKVARKGKAAVQDGD